MIYGVSQSLKTVSYDTLVRLTFVDPAFSANQQLRLFFRFDEPGGSAWRRGEDRVVHRPQGGHQLGGSVRQRVDSFARGLQSGFQEGRCRAAAQRGQHVSEGPCCGIWRRVLLLLCGGFQAGLVCVCLLGCVTEMRSTLGGGRACFQLLVCTCIVLLSSRALSLAVA